MKAPSITIISSTYNTATQTKKQFEETFMDTISFKIVVFNAAIKPHSISDDYIIITNMSIRDKALMYIKPGTKYFITDRTISTATIGKLYDIPEDTNVLLFNVTKDTVTEALTQLKKRGINHLNFFPCYPGIPSYNETCPYVITFGEADKVPKGNHQIIDLDIRPLDITLCVKIAIEVGVYDEIKQNISTISMRPSIELSYSYAKQLKEIKVLTKNLQSILNRYNDSIILVNDKERILFYNPPARKLLDIKDMKSPYLSSLIKEKLTSGRNFFFEINKHNYYVESIGDPQDNYESIIFFIRNMDNIQKIENDYRAKLVKSGLAAQYTFDDIIYESKAMKQLIQKAKQFAKGNSTIAIYGDSGCGKELIAQAIHNESDRKNEAFVAINFAALTPNLSEAELFGYVAGAFTGAKLGGNKGLFELAHKGTIFLDEIGDCSLEVQKKILRVIQERTVRPVGGNKLIPIDIRIITATNQNLYELVKKKEFREDLYYRLNVLPLKVPALKNRKEDVIPLFLYFMNEIFDVNIAQIPSELKNTLLNHPWNGNVRELRNFSEYIANCMFSNISWQNQLNDILLVDNSNAIQSETNEMIEIINYLESEYDLTTFYKILQIINSPPSLWNRVSISKALNDSSITESKVKRCLSILKQQHLIHSKPGHGSYINNLGKKFLDYCHDNLNDCKRS